MKPYEVELLLAQVGETSGKNELYRISFDGSIVDEQGLTDIVGRSEAILTFNRYYSQGQKVSGGFHVGC